MINSERRSRIWKLGEHNSWCKQTNYEIDTHVPMIISAPGIKGRGSKSYALTELVDIFPTLCDLAGIAIPSNMEGQSVRPLLDQPDLPWKEAVFSQFHRRPNVTPDGKRYMGYSMRTNRYHYIEWYYWDNENKVATAYVTAELYDHHADPEENINIAMAPENAQLVQQLAEQLKGGWRAALPKE